jgi:hypothetical protein
MLNNSSSSKLNRNPLKLYKEIDYIKSNFRDNEIKKIDLSFQILVKEGLSSKKLKIAKVPDQNIYIVRVNNDIRILAKTDKKYIYILDIINKSRMDRLIKKFAS